MYASRCPCNRYVGKFFGESCVHCSTLTDAQKAPSLTAATEAASSFTRSYPVGFHGAVFTGLETVVR